jgi:hypothetical protein
MYRLPVHEYRWPALRARLSCAAQYRRSSAASRNCVPQYGWSLLDWRVMAWLLWPRAGHWLD